MFVGAFLGCKAILSPGSILLNKGYIRAIRSLSGDWLQLSQTIYLYEWLVHFILK